MVMNSTSAVAVSIQAVSPESGRETPEETGPQQPGCPGARVRGGKAMSKGMDQKRDTKKKPAKSLLEKRAAKAEKKKK
jgi:hypothetical protein